MLYIHPIFQLLATCVSFYVLYLGVKRFRMLHLHKKSVFKWKQHVWLGIVVLCTWLFGMAAGLILVKNYWYVFFATGIHGKMGVVMSVFILSGLGTGLFMNKVKNKRKALPLIHGAGNLLAVMLAIIQLLTGFQVIRDFIWSV